jgi:diguanylate cyclase (GGDEF)-like protein
VELLVADSSRAHLRRVMSSNVAPSGGCPVATPTSCPAAIQGQSQFFESSSAIDACPYLRNREDAPLSALCVPVTIAGRPMGVLHATSEDGHPPTTGSAAALELIGRRTGERLTLVRAFARSETQAHTDPLTGLLNRRSLEHRVQDLVENGDPYIVAYADLDHFKALNDVHGHDAGDRALRLFAHVLRDSVRPSDIPARYGGEEFVVVLPDCGLDDAEAVLERVRERLATVGRDSQGPEFTVSAGLAASSVTKTFSEVVEAADRALLAAKAAGRDRVLISGAPIGIPDDARALDVSAPRPDDVRSE